MGATGPFPDASGTPPGPVYDRDGADRALARLQAEHEAIETSLLSLQDHAGRRLLEGAELTGVTKSRWAVTEQSITALWTYYDAYTKALGAALELRGRRRWPSKDDLADLTQRLRGPSATVGATGGKLAETFTLAELVARMNELYAASLDMIVAADAVWSALPARIDLLAAELRRTQSLAHSVGVRPGEHPAGDDLADITEELTALRAEVVSDPLAYWRSAGASSAPGGGTPDTRRYDRAARALEDVRREIEAVLEVRKDSEERLLRLRDVISRADRTLTEARAARGEVLAKIAATEVPAVSGPSAVLHERLSTAAEYRRNAQWHRLSPLLEALERDADDELLRARESLTAVTAPLAVRAELRGRLDAYRAKVARLGLGEDPLLIERYDAARRMLWSAPCDLRGAEAAVLRFQRMAADLAAQVQAGPAQGQGHGDGQGPGGPYGTGDGEGRDGRGSGG
ncbi:hypothetical protein [Streptomyces sp. 8L]|uniref:hypothetical protein n=1 Tax=Streptomyces sp. 8L TaxID=2877242 RepID=UPI001CD63BC4|nr:hypothetical protein [Streptomyces sp. 8L]MCA1223811.1 hypothetical protein [Streptomyces sp. 8L]